MVIVPVLCNIAAKIEREPLSLAPAVEKMRKSSYFDAETM